MADFPQTAELTSFTGGAENPLSEDGAWAPYGRELLRRGATGGALPTVEFLVNGMYWTRNAFVGNAEVWGCIAGGGLGAALEGWRVALWLNSPTSMTGYLSGYGGGISEDYFFRRYDGGSFDNWSAIGTPTGPEPPNKIGLRVTSSAVEQWAEVGGTWQLIESVGDTTHRGTWYASIELEEQGGINELAFGCFGAGALNRQHIYRILRA